jgi:hypothetical protein
MENPIGSEKKIKKIVENETEKKRAKNREDQTNLREPSKPKLISQSR